jgi:hypothetical protein
MRGPLALAAVVALVPAGAAFAHGPHGAFTIEGALAWVQPAKQADEGASTVLLVGGALALAALSLAAVFLLGRGRP